MPRLHINPGSPDTVPMDDLYGNVQLVFDPLDWLDGRYTDSHDVAQKAALAKRNRVLTYLRRCGIKCKGTSLTGQLRPYKSFGEPDGRTRTMYYINIDRGYV